jgi:hypothetical protein
VRLLQLEDVLAGRTPTMRVIHGAGHPGRAYFADTGELLITVELPPETRRARLGPAALYVHAGVHPRHVRQGPTDRRSSTLA